jgi:hypothetical protein
MYGVLEKLEIFWVRGITAAYLLKRVVFQTVVKLHGKG